MEGESPVNENLVKVGSSGPTGPTVEMTDAQAEADYQAHLAAAKAKAEQVGGQVVETSTGAGNRTIQIETPGNEKPDGLK